MKEDRRDENIRREKSRERVEITRDVGKEKRRE